MKHKRQLNLKCLLVILLGFSSGCAYAQPAEEGNQTEGAIVNPYSNYALLVQTTQSNLATIMSDPLMESKPFCRARFEQLAAGELVPINTSYLADSVEDLTAFVNREYGCENFALEDVTFTAGNRQLVYEQEPPFYVSQFNHQGEDYFSVFGSGMATSVVPRTPEVDFEGNPSFRVYEGDGACEQSTNAGMTLSDSMIGRSFGGSVSIQEENIVLDYNLELLESGSILIALRTMLTGSEGYCGIFIREAR